MDNLDKQIMESVNNICKDAGFNQTQRMRLIPVFKLINAKLTQTISILAETSKALRERDAKIDELKDALRYYQDELEEESDRIEFLEGEI